MVLRKNGRHFSALAAACLAAASLCMPAHAQSEGGLVWQGRVPAANEGYVPSVPAPNEGAVAPEPFYPSNVETPASNFGAPSTSEVDLIGDLLGRTAAPGAGYAAGTGVRDTAPPAPPAPITAPSPPSAIDVGEIFPAPPQPLPSASIAAIPPAASVPEADPWAGMKEATVPPSPAPQRQMAALPPVTLPQAVPTPPGRGVLELGTPSGMTALPEREQMCRRYLRNHGVKFVELDPIRKSKSCGIGHPVKVIEIAPGVAMKPAATLNCGAAARISKWVRDEVVPAARWKMWTGLTGVLNASSYRCSRIAGSRTISEHASGNALDVRGFTFSNGDVFDVEKKGFFSFRSKAFQKEVRRSACSYFGTVLGPGYNYDHRDHLHLDAKNRRRVVCK